jgi:microsomal epoxide hydrolase
MERFERFNWQGSAYAHLQATRPQTLAYALTDSPVGQLAWIAEKYHEWADPSQPIDADDILTTASIYWFTRTAGSAARLYKEDYGKASVGDAIRVPTGISASPFDNVPPVREWADDLFGDIVRWTEFPDGGHFPALETPGLLVQELRAFAAMLS